MIDDILSWIILALRLIVYLGIGWTFVVVYLLGNAPSKQRGMLFSNGKWQYYSELMAMVLWWPVVLLGFIYFVCESHVRRLWRSYRRTKRQ